ncbi:MAG: nucleotidyltransferase domain-containing protein [Rhodocyclaceae bacterium]|nr:nucleotidyltransferase domain-containing protein [Rhodocyclaceae bacterium]
MHPSDAPSGCFGLPQAVVDQINSILTGYPSIDRVVIYGSRAKGNFRPGSDIDLTVIGDRFSEAELLRLETQLDDLLLPYSIDLSRFQAIQSQDLIDHINRVGRSFYSK